MRPIVCSLGLIVPWSLVRIQPGPPPAYDPITNETGLTLTRVTARADWAMASNAPRAVDSVRSPRRQTQRDVGALRALARKLGVSEEIAVSIYEEQVERLCNGARVEGYIGIRAEKHAREALRRMKRHA